jgi:nucleobase:cation symporter-1, NCS1 family
MITDPVDVVGRLDSVTAVLLGALTFVVATIGLNIVANFVPPAFDITNIAPNKISWRAGGMIAATLSVFTTPWNLFSNPAVIHYTIDILACAIGPLYGILLVDYYVIKNEQIVVEDLYSMSPNGRYWYQGGVNLKAVYALIPASLIGFTFTMVPPFNIAQGSSFLSAPALPLCFTSCLPEAPLWRLLPYQRPNLVHRLIGNCHMAGTYEAMRVSCFSGLALALHF